MSKLYNLARVTTATTGTGAVTLGSAVPKFLTFAAAGAEDGDVVTYAITDGANSEIGRGAIGGSVSTLTRDVLKSTNSDSPINLSGAAEVFITAAAEDFYYPTDRIIPNAVGDGVADDTAAMEAALDLAVSTGKPLHLGGADKNYLLDSWESGGYEPAGPITIISDGATLSGPSGGAYFMRPDTVFDIRNTKFDTWTGVVAALSADEGVIVGARFERNACTGITGIPINIECEFRDSYIGRNRFSDCTGGYVIRIGDNDYARQDEWSGNIVENNVLRNISASSTGSLFAIIVYGRDTLIAGNDILGLSSADGEAIGIYTKLRFSRVVHNKVRNVNSSGSSGAALDVVGISVKGATRTTTGSGPQGYDVVCANNTVQGVGSQGTKGAGIRAQISGAIVANNVIEDVGLIGINVDDSNGSTDNLVIGNMIRGWNMIGVDGINLVTYGDGHRIANNVVRDFDRCINVGTPSNTLRGTIITGNVLKFTNGGVGVRLNSSDISSIKIFGNTYSGTSTNAISLAATPGKLILMQEDFTDAAISAPLGGTPPGGSNFVNGSHLA